MADLRPANKNDLAILRRLDDRCFDEAWSEKIWLGWLSNPKRYRCWLLMEADVALGFLLFGVVLDEAELLRIGVDPARQGEGLAAAMLRTVQSGLAAQGVASCHLEVRESNYAAQRLYQHCGWTPSGRRRNYYAAEDGSEDALLFTLGLD
ncbi:ribosomal protein S18-alanine N-acetyltransferase [Marinobacterium sp. YM272]|uniref:ribosomal protein S18-alanine N-acetyltransferase n=1 Tax=Marinobacterium sp. YM272 TaxID=3421654 RepID=UPI003D7F2989